MNTEYRYAYIKNGDVISQLKAIGAEPDVIPHGGPNAFIADFMANVGDSPLLLISNQNYSNRYRQHHVEAYVLRMSLPALGALGIALARTLAFITTLIHLFRFRPSRVLCGSLGYPLWAAFIYSRLASASLVHSLHNRIEYKHYSWRKQFATLLNKYILRRVSAVICHGPYLKQQLLDIGICRTRIKEFDCGFRDMWEQIDADKGEALPANHQYKTITYLGRIHHSKGIFDLLDACSDILKHRHGLKLAYIGDGPDLQALKAKVAEMELHDRVIFYGSVSHEKLADIIKVSYIVVTPTKSHFPEGRCMAAMESLALGVPVIAPAFGPFPYLIKDNCNGLLFAPDSINDLKVRLNSVLDDTVFYSRLCHGARLSGKELIDPPITFYKAVQWAFDTCSRK